MKTLCVGLRASAWRYGLFILALVNPPSPSDASTRVCGTVTSEHWTKANSPYLVTCDVVVANVLTIDPGVTVVFESTNVFEVNGVISAIGTAAEPIVFTKSIASVGWQGILFNYSSPGSKLIYCTISGSKNSGIRIFRSNPDLQHCVVTNNSPAYNSNGGGIWADITAADLTLQSCTIANNSCSHGGGGAGLWAKISGGNLVLRDCVVTNNSAYPFNGGGIYAVISSPNHLDLERCIIAGNAVWPATFVPTTYGGGVYVSGDVVLRNCILSNNVSTAAGGALYAESGSLSATNCLFSGNKALSTVCLSSSAQSAAIVNCTIAYNSQLGLSSGGGDVQVMNSIFYGNNSQTIQMSGAAFVSYSDIQNGFPGEGNIDLPPQFMSQTDLRISSQSPCVDAGSPTPLFYDACSPPSQGGPRNDMGAYGGPLACGWRRNPVVVSEFFRGLTAFYPFNGNANDDSGGENDGVLHGADWKYSSDQFGGSNSLYLNTASTPAWDLDGAYVTAPRSSKLDFNVDFTVSAWVNLKSGNPAIPPFFAQSLISNGWDGTNVNLRILSNYLDFGGQDVLEFVWRTSGQIEHAIAWLAPVRDTWWQTTVVRSGSNVSLFRNGVLLASSVMTTPVANSPEIWFGRYLSSTYPLIGGIDNVRMFNRALSLQEVLHLYEYERNTLPHLTIAANPLRLTFFVAEGTTNQIEASTDLRAWSAHGPPLSATNWVIYQDVDLSGTQQYFRVRSTAP